MAVVEEEEQAGIPEWVVTFGDMMSLLLTFFIMLLSMSELKEEERYQALAESLRQRFGHESSIASLMPGPAMPLNSALAKLASMGRAMRANTMNGGDKVRAPVGDYPRVQAIRPGKDVTVGGVVYFTEGSSQLTQKSKRVLQAAIREIDGKPQKVEIRGHTSARPLPPGSPFRNHWDLAYARCFKVMDFLVKGGINSKRIRLGVAADNERLPADDNPTLQNTDPRVEVYMLSELTEGLDNAKVEEKR